MRMYPFCFLFSLTKLLDYSTGWIVVALHFALSHEVVFSSFLFHFSQCIRQSLVYISLHVIPLVSRASLQLLLPAKLSLFIYTPDAQLLHVHLALIPCGLVLVGFPLHTFTISALMYSMC
ncbi:hypothetical protein EV401DRAFT_2043787 [Pisolithus croceorrhizus]|nr:hypothetical protein EV401DRAFT_2043787 [Pisolithus croceorrhizus]